MEPRSICSPTEHLIVTTFNSVQMRNSCQLPRFHEISDGRSLLVPRRQWRRKSVQSASLVKIGCWRATTPSPSFDKGMTCFVSKGCTDRWSTCLLLPSVGCKLSTRTMTLGKRWKRQLWREQRRQRRTKPWEIGADGHFKRAAVKVIFPQFSWESYRRGICQARQIKLVFSLSLSLSLSPVSYTHLTLPTKLSV